MRTARTRVAVHIYGTATEAAKSEHGGKLQLQIAENESNFVIWRTRDHVLLAIRLL